MLPMLLVAAMIGGGARASAQAARVPVLAPLGATRGTCKVTAPPAALRNQGVSQMVLLMISGDSARLLSVATGLRGQPVMFNAWHTIRVTTRLTESEKVFAHFAPDGRLESGTRRSSTGGLPSRLREEHSAALSGPDGIAAYALAKSVVAFCVR